MVLRRRGKPHAQPNIKAGSPAWVCAWTLRILHYHGTHIHGLSSFYMVLKDELGNGGMLVAFSDDVYLHGPPANVAAAVSAAPILYKKVGLRIGWGPAKSELSLPPNVDPETLPLLRGDDGRVLPHQVRAWKLVWASHVADRCALTSSTRPCGSRLPDTIHS